LFCHDSALSLTGGRPGVRDIGLLESAVARPFSGYYRAFPRKAAALVESLACNHAFIDGNKRTAFLALNLFLRRSGYRLLPNDVIVRGREIEDMILDLVNHRLDFDGVVAWIEARLRRSKAK